LDEAHEVAKILIGSFSAPSVEWWKLEVWWQRVGEGRSLVVAGLRSSMLGVAAAAAGAIALRTFSRRRAAWVPGRASLVVGIVGCGRWSWSVVVVVVLVGSTWSVVGGRWSVSLVVCVCCRCVLVLWFVVRVVLRCWSCSVVVVVWVCCGFVLFSWSVVGVVFRCRLWVSVAWWLVVGGLMFCLSCL
jgi:hypothetical protein